MLNSKVAKIKKLKGSSKKFRWTPFAVFFFVLFAIEAATLIGSLVWTFLNALKDRHEYMENCISLPKDWLFNNFIRAFEQLSASGKNIFVMFYNSLWLSILGPTIGIATQAMASYVMSKYKFPGKNIIWGIMITTMIIPIDGSTASSYRMYQILGIYNSPLFLVTSVTGLGGSMMMIAAFNGVSRTYAEAAFMEGAGHFRVFWQIMLPQIFGLLSALWITSFIGSWNNYMGPLMWLPDYITLSTGLYIYQEENIRSLDTPVLFAGALLCMIPVVTLFIIFQDKLMNLSFGGGIKG